MNDAKTEFIILGTTNNLKKNTLDNIEIGNTKIHHTSKIKFLGVHLDQKLSFKDHIQNRLKKANYNIMLIYNIHKYMNIDTAKMLLSTLVLSQLDYVNFIYSAAKHWNDHPEHIKKAKDIKTFKSLLKLHFFKLPFLSQ